MQTVHDHLDNTLADLTYQRNELERALELATNSGYDQPWLDAIDKALLNNHEATRHLENVRANIRHPAEETHNLKPGCLRPKAR